MTTATPRILDCTLRDGGYYNDWDFPPALVAEYLKACSDAGINLLELGFRFIPDGRFFGAHSHATDEFLASLELPKGVDIAVMVNTKELLAHPDGPVSAVNVLFNERAASPVSTVRIACHFAETTASRGIAARLKELGYTVALNLMQAGGKSDDEVTRAAEDAASWGSIDVLYFADSLGNMNADMVRSTLAALRRGWSGPIGVHAHNNMGQALGNSIAAVESGATWVDGTIGGMGRGAGNAASELLLLEFNRRGWGRYSPDPVFHLAIGPFEELRKEHRWGPSLLYHLSASYGIHPTYVQEMLGKGMYDAHHIIGVLEFLKDSGASAYSDDRLQEAAVGGSWTGEGSWSAAGWATGRDMLIVGSGPQIVDHLPALCRFVDRRQPVVVCLNMNPVFPAEKVTAYAACHRASLLMDSDGYRTLRRPLIAPMTSVPDPIRRNLHGVEVYDFGMGVRPGQFSIQPTGCLIPTPLVAAYALALAEASSARRILLAGFDGYTATDHRHREMARVLRTYLARPEALPVVAVTPTSYEIAKDSIYSPTL